jgi:hypothetical protein
MTNIKDKDLQLLKTLVSSTQNTLRKSLATYLQSRYSTTIVTDRYIVAVGDIPIALVAHLDTVFLTPVKNLYYDSNKKVFWSSEGLGADDRAGIFAILKIIQSGLRPSVIFTTDEERGGIGASYLAEIKCPIPNLKYLIQLDRRGKDDCVFYDCDTKDFIQYVKSFGFKEKMGTFSDISFLCPAWNVCGVNLSVGYENEHSVQEVLHMPFLYKTIEKVKKMLNDSSIPDFKYEEVDFKLSAFFSKTDFESYFNHACYKCKQPYNEYELIPVLGVDDKTRFYCVDCVASRVNWCERCGEAYEVTANAHKTLCRTCEQVKNN